jgi:hypothetical protein
MLERLVRLSDFRLLKRVLDLLDRLTDPLLLLDLLLDILERLPKRLTERLEDRLFIERLPDFRLDILERLEDLFVNDKFRSLINVPAGYCLGCRQSS